MITIQSSEPVLLYPLEAFLLYLCPRFFNFLRLRCAFQHQIETNLGVSIYRMFNTNASSYLLLKLLHFFSLLLHFTPLLFFLHSRSGCEARAVRQG